VREDSAAASRTLSRPGTSSIFVATASGRRAVIGELDGQGLLAALVAVEVETGARVSLGTLPAGSAYLGVAHKQWMGDVLVAELAQAGGLGATDVLAFRAGAAPVVLSRGAALCGVAAGRAAILAGPRAQDGTGDLASVRVDSAQPIALGGGDGLDACGEVAGGRVLMTVHLGASAQVRWVGIDGTGAVTLGHAGAAERGFGFAGDRAIYTRSGDPATGMVSARIADGSDERVLAPSDASPVLITPEAHVLFTSAGALRSSDAAGGSSRTLDADAGTVRFAHLYGDRVIFTGANASAATLRVARLDGQGAQVLYQDDVSLPVATALSPDGRVVFHVSPLGQLEGGFVDSVKLDGSELAHLGRDALAADGSKLGDPSDQDFEAMTPAGRVVIEHEYEGSTFGSQLLTTGANDGAARAFTPLAAIRFAAILP
jgi:hypothetical protein